MSPARIDGTAIGQALQEAVHSGGVPHVAYAARRAGRLRGPS